MKEVDRAETLDDLQDNPLLASWFRQLTLSNEARRCINYLFKAKCERIDLSFLTMKNLKKVYLKYEEIHQIEMAEKAKKKIKGLKSLLRFG